MASSKVIFFRRGHFWDFRSIFWPFFWQKKFGAIFQPAKFFRVPLAAQAGGGTPPPLEALHLVVKCWGV